MSAIVIGAGAVSSIGLGAAATAAAQRAGIAGHADHPFMLDRAGEPMVVSRVPFGDEDMDGVERMLELGIPAAREALGTLVCDRAVDILLALPESRPGLPHGFATEVGSRLAERLADTAAVGRLKIRPRGHAAGLSLLGEAVTMLTRDPDALILVGGVDSWLVPETLEWLDSQEILHSAEMPWGFCPGEAAGFCLLAEIAQLVGGFSKFAAGGAARRESDQ